MYLTDEELTQIRNALNDKIDKHVQAQCWQAAHQLTDVRDKIQRELDKRD